MLDLAVIPLGEIIFILKGQRATENLIAVFTLAP